MKVQVEWEAPSALAACFTRYGLGLRSVGSGSVRAAMALICPARGWPSRYVQTALAELLLMTAMARPDSWQAATTRHQMWGVGEAVLTASISSSVSYDSTLAATPGPSDAA